MATNANALLQGTVDRAPYPYYSTLTGGQFYGGSTGTGITTPTGCTTPNSLQAGQTAVQQYQFFQYGLGSADPITALNLTKKYTNLPGKGGQLPNTRAVIIDSLGFQFASYVDLIDQYAFGQNAYFEFQIDGKVYFDGLIYDYPAGGGLAGYSTRQAQAAWNVGFPNPHATRRWAKWSRYLPPITNFSVVVNFPDILPVWLPQAGLSGIGAGVGITLRCIMDCVSDRSLGPT